MTDHYLKNPPKQPKREIADYVEQQGILVPRRFDSLKEAKASGLPIIARAEHPQDYDGASGIVNSVILQDEKYSDVESEEQLKQRILDAPKGKGISLHRQYCRFLNLDENKFKKEFSFSYWELLEGVNRTVVADSAIANKYHVMSEGKKFLNYTIVENSNIKEFIRQLPAELREGLPALVELYESVRHLDRFDPNHCPIMEIQTTGDKDYFLQYHRTRDFEPAQFTLERGLGDGELEVPFVRGATQKEGMNCRVTVYYANDIDWRFDPQGEDGSYDLHYNHIFPELRVRQRKVQMIHGKKLEWELMKFVVDHLGKSKLFKPQVSIIHNIEDLLSGEKLSDLYKRTKSGKNSYLDLHVISDGRKAHVKRI